MHNIPFIPRAIEKLSCDSRPISGDARVVFLSIIYSQGRQLSANNIIAVNASTLKTDKYLVNKLQ